MKKTLKIFSKIFVLAIAAVVICTFDASAATKKSKSTKKTTTPAATTVVVDNKTSKFNETLSDISAAATDTSVSDRAERVRRQRALLDGSGNKDSSPKAPSVTGANTCDTALRKCMAEKCGEDFTQCAKDSTTIWGDKMDSCRRQTKCTGHEYALLAPEILADRDANERMTYYQSVISCGNKYNSCIFTECGTTLDKCLSKSDGDRVISKCESVARACKEQDSGLASRVMTVFATMRKIAQAQAVKDEKRLYELRDLMRNQCKRFGAMFDERTLDCVYTVNFFAGDDNKTPKASKKLYAGDSFQCNANWFGIDVTTFKENAYRLTRSQTAASSAMLGAGVGTAAGLLSSGAIGRALETQKAAKAVKEAKEAEENGGEGEGEGEGGGSNGGGDGSSGSGDEGENATNNNVSLNFEVYAENTEVKLKNLTLTCTYTDNEGHSKEIRETPNIINHHIKRRNVPSDASCTLTGGLCDAVTKTAGEFAVSSRISTQCQPIETCINRRGTWEGTNDSDGHCVTVTEQNIEQCGKKKTAAKCATLGDLCEWKTSGNSGICRPKTTAITAPTAISSPGVALSNNNNAQNDCAAFCATFVPDQRIINLPNPSQISISSTPCVSNDRCKEKIADKCRTLVGQTFTVNGHEYSITSSVAAVTSSIYRCTIEKRSHVRGRD